MKAFDGVLTGTPVYQGDRLPLMPTLSESASETAEAAAAPTRVFGTRVERT